MANDGRNAELEALLDVPGINTARIKEQINERAGKTTPKVETPIPNITEPIKKEEQKTEVPDPETIKAAMLREMWGEQFSSVEDFKKANIPGQLQELETLRRTKQDLETQLKTKPKYHYANDNIAKYDEFVRSTGIEDAVVFNKINGVDVANMDNMDALVLQHIVEHPSLAGQEPEVRDYFERKYGLDSAKIDHKRVEDDEITQEEYERNMREYKSNLIGVTSDGEKAKKQLKDLKSKIKMPDIPADEPPEGKPKWTPEIEKARKAEWGKVNEAMGTQFATIPIRIKGSTEPIVNFAVPEETKKAILQTALDYAVSNQMEINEANVKPIAETMYSQIIVSNLDQIAHAVFERARSMSQEEALKVYSNPSPKNTDKPPVKTEPMSDEAKREKAFQMEYKR